MVSVRTGRTIAWLLSALAVSTGCVNRGRQPRGFAAPEEEQGRETDPSLHERAPRAPPEVERELWEHFDELGSYRLVTGSSGISAGHFAEPHSLTIRINPGSEQAYLAGGNQPLPNNTLIVAQHTNQRSGSRAQTFVMVKGAETWSYLVLQPDGRIDEVSVRPCRDCHELSPRDSVFGPPTSMQTGPK